MLKYGKIQNFEMAIVFFIALGGKDQDGIVFFGPSQSSSWVEFHLKNLSPH